MKYPLVDLRGRAYECAGCYNYQGERSMVQSHYYNNHVKPEDVPFRCKLCNFKCISEKALEQHVNWYKDHKTLVNRRKEDGQIYSDENIMIKSDTPKFLEVDKELIRLDTKTSEQIWEARKRKPRKTTKTSSTTDQDTTAMNNTTMHDTSTFSITTTDSLTTMPAALQPIDTLSTEPMPTLPILELPTITLQDLDNNHEDSLDIIDQLLGTMPQETSQFYSNELILTTDPLSLQTPTSPIYTPTISMPEPLSYSPTQTNSNPTRRVIKTNTSPNLTLEQPAISASIPPEQTTTSPNMTQEGTTTANTTHVTHAEFQQLLDQNNRTNQLLESAVKQLEDNNKYVYWLGQTVRRAQQTTKQHIERLITAQETTLRHIMQTTQPRNSQRTQQRTQPGTVQRRRNTTQRQRPQNRPRSRSPRR